MEDNICKHIAIIMDGNRRWAKKYGMPKSFGHKKGAENVVKITRAMKESGVKYLTLYAFSTENWQRSEEEVSALMQLLRDYLDKEFKEIMDNNVEELLKALEKVNSLMTDENIERATTEQLLRYNELINKIKARLIELV